MVMWPADALAFSRATSSKARDEDEVDEVD